MAIARAGTFNYSVTLTGLAELRSFPAQDMSGAASELDEDRRTRLVGLTPAAELGRDAVIFRSSERALAAVAAVSVPFDPGLLEILQAGDVMNVVRLHNGGVALSVVRGADSIVAVGVVTASPLGRRLVAGGVSLGQADGWRSTNQLVVIIDLTSIAVPAGDTGELDGYGVHLSRGVNWDRFGGRESGAIWKLDACDGAAAIRSAKLLEREYAGLQLTRWPPTAKEIAESKAAYRRAHPVASMFDQAGVTHLEPGSRQVADRLAEMRPGDAVLLTRRDGGTWEIALASDESFSVRCALPGDRLAGEVAGVERRTMERATWWYVDGPEGDVEECIAQFRRPERPAPIR